MCTFSHPDIDLQDLISCPKLGWGMYRVPLEEVSEKMLACAIEEYCGRSSVLGYAGTRLNQLYAELARRV